MCRSTTCFLWIAALSFGSSACVPIISHGPRVEPGRQVAILTSAEIRPEPDGGGSRFAATPNIGLSLSHGWLSSDPEGGAYQMGIHVPAMIVFAPSITPYLLQGDAFYQLPRSSSLDAGIGFTATLVQGMPYLQVGRIRSNGSGWYTTQGLLMAWEASDAGTGDARFRWVPSLVYQSRNRSSTTHFFIGAAFGSAPEGIYDSGRSRAVVTTGMTMVIHGRNAHR